MNESSLTTTTILITSIGSVVGGMLGAYLISLLKRIRTKTIRKYSVNNETNYGNEDEQRGEPMHGKGKPITKDNKPLWKWTNTPCGVPKKHSLIYGPYSHDLNLPGKYRVEFLVMGNGFRQDNILILTLDVTGIVYRRVPLYNNDGTPILDTDKKIKTEKYTEFFRIYGSHNIRKCDLADGKWHKFTVDVYSNGFVDLYEFRARERKDYQLAQDEEVYFDTITVKKIN